MRVLVLSFVTAATGLAVFKYMTGTDAGYLDLSQPTTEKVLCLTHWPLRHDYGSWSDPKLWQEWMAYRTNMSAFVRDNMCAALPRAMVEQRCSDVRLPLSAMNRNLGVPLLLHGTDYWWGNDTVEMHGYGFLFMTPWLWVMLMVHDLSLLSRRWHDHVLDLQGIQHDFPRWRYLWRLLGFRFWCRLAVGRGFLIGERLYLRKTGRIVAVLGLPLLMAWAAFVVPMVLLPTLAIFFAAFPMRLGRLVVAVHSFIVGLLGVGLVLQCLGFLCDVGRRQQYAVTWDAESTLRSPCVCGCVYPLQWGRCIVLMAIGAIVAFRAFALFGRTWKGLRRSNWANLLSVLFSVPLNLYEVQWTLPDGRPAHQRAPGEPVQAEPAFDPFVLMDQQMESGDMTLTIAPALACSPKAWSVDRVAQFFDGLGLQEQSDMVRRFSLDGAAFSELVADDAGLAELGVTSRIHVAKIRGRLSALGAHAAGMGEAQRKMVGPMPARWRAPPADMSYEYIVGPLGFPWRLSHRAAAAQGVASPGQPQALDCSTEAATGRSEGPTDAAPGSIEFSSEPPGAKLESMIANDAGGNDGMEPLSSEELWLPGAFIGGIAALQNDQQQHPNPAQSCIGAPDAPPAAAGGMPDVILDPGADAGNSAEAAMSGDGLAENRSGSEVGARAGRRPLWWWPHVTSARAWGRKRVHPTTFSSLF